MEQLSKKIYHRSIAPIKIMQFGEGNFLRAFVDWMIQKMNDRGVYHGHVVVVQPMPSGRVHELAKQDGLYTLYLQGMEDGIAKREHEVIDVLEDFINPFTEYASYLKYAESSDLETIISNTTEAGITLVKEDIQFEQCPISFPGKLLAFLHHRYVHFKGDLQKGLAIIPCELIDNNGDVLRDVLIELAKIKGYDDLFLNWLTTANHFTSTLVDRIVPGYPADEIEAITQELGYVDSSIVKGEIFHLWVLKKSPFIESVFPCHKAGLHALYADSIKPYKERKVKILNGTHTAMVPVAYLYGIDTVKESIENPQIGDFAKRFIFEEVVPTIALPKEEMVFFANSVLERFLNPYVRHELMSIALNSISKYKERVLKTVYDYVNIEKKMPKYALFSLASLIVFYRGRRDQAAIALKDDPQYLQFFADVWGQYDKNGSVTELVQNVLANTAMWGEDLSKEQALLSLVTENVTAILQQGLPSALTALLGA